MARTRGTSQPLESTRAFMTPEGQENYLISLANNLAEQRLRDGTASSQEVTHFLKLGSTSARLEREKLEAENILLQAKAEALRSQQQSEALYSEAISAFRRYAGSGDDDEDY